MILKSDQEPAIRELLDAVKRERTEPIELMLEESPVGEHKSNGEVENTAQIIQGQLSNAEPIPAHTNCQAYSTVLILARG